MNLTTLKIQNILQRSADKAEKALNKINTAMTGARWNVVEFACNSYAEAEDAGHEPWHKVIYDTDVTDEELPAFREKKWQEAKAEWLQSERGERERHQYAVLVVQRQAAQDIIAANKLAQSKMAPPEAKTHFVADQDK